MDPFVLLFDNSEQHGGGLLGVAVFVATLLLHSRGCYVSVSEDSVNDGSCDPIFFFDRPQLFACLVVVHDCFGHLGIPQAVLPKRFEFGVHNNLLSGWSVVFFDAH